MDAYENNYSGLELQIGGGIRNILTANIEGIDYIICHTTIEVEKDFIQFIIISTESNRDTAIKYSDETSQTITLL